MKQKHTGFLASILPVHSPNINQPLKTPSPDRKRTNIITPTKSPELIDIHFQPKPNTPNRNQPTPYNNYYTIANSQYFVPKQHRNKHNCKNNSKQLASQKSCCYLQTDYSKLLKEKDTTIRQLQRIIAMINSNAHENRDISAFRMERSGIVEDYQSQIQELTNENQTLITMLETKSRNKHDNILNREVSELKQSIHQQNQQLQEVTSVNSVLMSAYKQHQEQIKQLREQNTRLHNNLKEVPSTNGKQRLTLQKIKEVYQQNLSTFKKNVYTEIESMYDAYQSNLEQLGFKVQEAEDKMRKFQEKLIIGKQKKSPQHNNYQVILEEVEDDCSDHKNHQLKMDQILNVNEMIIPIQRQNTQSISIRDQESFNMKKAESQIMQSEHSNSFHRNMIDSQIIQQHDQTQRKQEQVKRLKDTIILLQNNKEVQMKTIQQSLRNYQIKIRKLQTQLNESNSKLKNYQAQNKKSKQQQQITEAKVSELVYNYEEQIKLLRGVGCKKCEEYKQQQKQICGLMGEKEENYKKVSQQLLDLRDTIKSQQEATQSQKRQNTILKETIAQLQTSFSQINTQHQSQIKEERDKLHQLTSQIESTHSDHEQKMHQVYQEMLLLLKKDSITKLLQQLKLNITNQHQFKTKQYLELLQKHHQSVRINQAKIVQCQRMNVLHCQLREQLIKSTQQKLLLQQKISFLEKNITIYERQLHERNSICQQLIIDKATSQRQIATIKKVKKQQTQTELQWNQNNEFLQQQITNLLEMQRHREQQINHLMPHAVHTRQSHP